MEESAATETSPSKLNFPPSPVTTVEPLEEFPLLEDEEVEFESESEFLLFEEKEEFPIVEDDEDLFLLAEEFDEPEDDPEPEEVPDIKLPTTSAISSASACCSR